MSPPHDTSMPAEAIIVKDVLDSSAQNINPLTTEDLKKILDQSTLQARLCENPVLVSVDELQKAIAEITRDKVNTQEPPFFIPSTTSDQPLIQTSVDTSTKVDTTIKVDLVEQRQTTIEEKETTINQPDAKKQGASQIIVIEKQN